MSAHPYHRDVIEHYRKAIPVLCGCLATSDENMVLHPSFCERHKIEAQAARVAFGYVKYERAFIRESDARDRARIVTNLHGDKDLLVTVIPVSHYWLVLARWGEVKTTIWSKA